jgi:hypothetical protein
MKYDTLADDWTTPALMPHGSSCHSTSICNGLVYIIGAGADDHEVLRFDPASAEWTMLAPTLKRGSNRATFVLGGSLYVGGGGTLRERSSVERYDVANDTWTAVADMLEGRLAYSAVAIGCVGLAEEQDLFDSLIDKLLVSNHQLLTSE